MSKWALRMSLFQSGEQTIETGSSDFVGDEIQFSLLKIRWNNRNLGMYQQKINVKILV